MKPKGYGIRSTDSQPAPIVSPVGVIEILRTAPKTLVSQNDAVTSNYKKFVAFKTANPTKDFPGDDKKMNATAPFGRAVNGIHEADLSDDMHVIYVTRPGRDENNLPVVKIFIFGIFSHKDLGISDKSQPRINQQMAERFKNAMP